MRVVPKELPEFAPFMIFVLILFASAIGINDLEMEMSTNPVYSIPIQHNGTNWDEMYAAPKWLVNPAFGSSIAFTRKPTCPVFTNGVFVIRFEE